MQNPNTPPTPKNDIHKADFVTVFEVGPRDGLQNEKSIIQLQDKVQMINDLSETGLKKIEAGSFVSPEWVPQMASTDEVFKAITRKTDVRYTALTPNLRGLEAALTANVDEIAILGAASERFSHKNINCSIADSIKRFTPVVHRAKEHNIPIRGYVSCVVDCPYEGRISVNSVANISKKLFEMGCYEISLGDSIGTGTPQQIQQVISAVAQVVPLDKIAIHCHDTYGMAIANICAALEMGVRSVDSSVAGLGGCPYAKGSTGNVASEDVVYLLNGLGLECGINLDALIQVGNTISKKLDRQNQSHVAIARNRKNSI